MATIRQILQSKGTTVWTISPDATVYEALKTMNEKNVGALVVLENGKLTGIISERDYARSVILKGRSSSNTKVSEIMETKVYYISPNCTYEECMALMTEKRVRHLPVLENNEIIGIISIGDVVKSVISAQEFRIEQLENYILGT
jgi:IMP dehydrogenase